MRIFVTFAVSAVTAALTVNSAIGAQIYHKDGSTIDLFGTVSGLYLSAHAANPDRYYQNAGKDGGIVSASTLGIALRSVITDHLDAIAFGQWDMADGEFDDRNNYLYAGIDAYEYGTLIIGQAEDAYYAVAGVTDIFNYIETRANDYYVMGDKTPGMIMYKFSALSWDLRLSYKTAKDYVYGSDLSVRSGYAASIAGRLTDNISMAYGMSYTDFTYSGQEPSEKMIDYFAPIYAQDYKVTPEEGYNLAKNQKIGYKYDYGFSIAYGVLGDGLYAAIEYTGTDYEYLKHTLHSVEFAASYRFVSGLELIGGISWLSYNGINVALDLNLGVAWNFSPAFKVFCEGVIDLDAEPERFYGSNNVQDWMGENKLVLGAQFSF